jgi:hypothetical protein
MGLLGFLAGIVLTIGGIALGILFLGFIIGLLVNGVCCD